MDTDARRLTWLIRNLGRTQRGFAREVGASRQVINNVVHGRASLSRALADAIADRYGVSLDWLLRGTGEPFPDMATTTTTEPGQRTALVLRFPPRCADCGQELREGDEFCPGCQARLEWPPETD